MSKPPPQHSAWALHSLVYSASLAQLVTTIKYLDAGADIISQGARSTCVHDHWDRRAKKKREHSGGVEHSSGSLIGRDVDCKWVAKKFIDLLLRSSAN